MKDDQENFLLMREGDKDAFERLFKTYYAPLVLFARTFIADRDESEEMVQGFFMKLWEDREKIDITISVKSYLFRAVRNRCLNQLKHEKIKQEYQSAIQNLPLSEKSLEPFFMEIGLIEKIEKSIALLPPRRKEIFLMSREQGLKYREIAEQLNISVKTVETQMGQALKDLREQLKTYRHLIVSFIITTKTHRIGGCHPTVVIKNTNKH
jgi:RNA polymerase sigma-70 factor, ECF subfamily